MQRPHPTHPDDLELTARALQADRDARLIFSERMGCVPRMLSVMNRRLARPLPREDIEDLVQDTLVTIWRRLGDYSGKASLETWSYPFCRYHLANRIRAHARRPYHVPIEAAPTEYHELNKLFEFEDIYSAMERLDSFTADIIRLKHYEQLSFVEVSERLRLSPNTAKTRYYRGLARLRTLLAPTRSQPPIEKRVPAKNPLPASDRLPASGQLEAEL